MAEPDAFDPTHALDGWRVPSPAPVDLDLQSLRPGGRPGQPSGAGASVQPEAFDPVHALDGWRPPVPAPLDLELKPLLRTAGTGPDGSKKAWLKARGYPMSDVEDVELPEVPSTFAVLEAAVVVVAPEPPPAPESAQSIEPFEAKGLDDLELPDLSLPEVTELPDLDFRAPPPQAPDPHWHLEGLDLPEVAPPPDAAPRPPPDPRLLARWQPQAWTALARRVRGASTEVMQTPQGPKVEAMAPQWLCALWPPQPADAPLLGCWPELTALVDAETAFGALHQLLTELPPEARLWPADLDTDWALIADLVLRQDSRLRPAQAQALRELARAERGASRARVHDGYAPQGRVTRRRP